MTAKVAVLHTMPQTVLGDYDRLMHLAEYEKFLPKNKETLLKLNLSWSLYFPACSTEPWQLEGVVKTLQAEGYKKLIPVENKTVVTDPLKGVRLNRWNGVMDKYGLKFVPLPDVKWVNYKPKHELLVLDKKVFPEGLLIPEMFIGKNVLHLPTVKTHGHTQMTGAMKNAFGGLLKEARHHCHRYIHDVLVDLLTIQKEIHTGIFAVMDGTVAGDGAGPRTMIPVAKNVILASGDQVAIDAISAKMMGYDPMSIPFIKTAHDKGLGIGDPDQIDVIGDDVSKENWRFQTKRSPVVFFDQLFRKSAIEHLLFHTPLFKLCIAGSAIYHDWIWYPTIGKVRIAKFSKTEWGQLFETYK